MRNCLCAFWPPLPSVRPLPIQVNIGTHRMYQAFPQGNQSSGNVQQQIKQLRGSDEGFFQPLSLMLRWLSQAEVFWSGREHRQGWCWGPTESSLSQHYRSPESHSKCVPSCPCSSEVTSWPQLERVGWRRAGKRERTLECRVAWRTPALGVANTLSLPLQSQLSCYNSANEAGDIQKLLLRIIKAMEDWFSKERIKGFYTCCLVMQTWNENMESINTYLKGLSYWEGYGNCKQTKCDNMAPYTQVKLNW